MKEWIAPESERRLVSNDQEVEGLSVALRGKEIVRKVV